MRCRTLLTDMGLRGINHHPDRTLSHTLLLEWDALLRQAGLATIVVRVPFALVSLQVLGMCHIHAEDRESYKCWACVCGILYVFGLWQEMWAGAYPR
jgi:hypothetical protein